MNKKLFLVSLSMLAAFSLASCGGADAEVTTTFKEITSSTFNDLGDHADYLVYHADVTCLNTSDSAVNFPVTDFTLHKDETVLTGVKFLTGTKITSVELNGVETKITAPVYEEDSYVVLGKTQEEIWIVFDQAIDSTYTLYLGNDVVHSASAA